MSNSKTGSKLMQSVRKAKDQKATAAEEAKTTSEAAASPAPAAKPVEKKEEVRKIKFSRRVWPD